MSPAATHPTIWPGVVIVGCGAAKRQTCATAGELYTGSLFRAAYAWAASVAGPGRVFILSAKHGLVPSSQELMPYDLRMGQPGSVSSSALRRQTDALGIYRTPAILIAGTDYASRLVFAKAPGTMLRLFDHALSPGARGLGYQIGWLRRNVGKLPAGLQHKGAA